MAEGYVKILSSILRSSIWKEPDDVRIVWLTLLAMADKDGFVGASIDGIAHETRTVSEERVAECLEKFMSPDPNSRTKEFEGRRLQEVDRGWLVLNYRTIRDMHGEESKRAAKRRWWTEKKAREQAGSVADQVKAEQTGTVELSEKVLVDPSRISSNGSGSALCSSTLGSDSVARAQPDEFSSVRPTSTQRCDRSLRGGPGERTDVQALHKAWRDAFGRPGAVLRHNAGDDAYALAEAIDGHGLDDCLLVAQHAKADPWVSGKADQAGVTHESIRYIFGNEETFSRILAAAKKAAAPRPRELTATELKKLGRG